MKLSRSAWAFLLVVSCGNGFCSPAQQADDQKLFEETRAKAEKGDAEAEFQIGACYSSGQLVDQDYAEAVKWYRKAAEQGLAKAQCDLGTCFFEGKGIQQDKTQAAEWFQRAAEQGDAKGQNNFAICFEGGFGVTSNSVEAVKWFRKAAEQGFVNAEFNLGLHYASGDGVSKDSVQAVKWWRKAAAQDYAPAEYNLGCYCRDGEGLAKDYEAAALWFRRAAEQGFASAQCNLGVAFAKGEGVPKDYVEAYKWYNLASAQGDSTSKKLLAAIELSMTPDQIASAQRLTREFASRKPSESGKFVSVKRAEDSNPVATGTGFFITEDGFLITNEHVVKEADHVRLVTSVGFLAGRVVRKDEANDLALLKAEGHFLPLPIAASRAMRLGSAVAMVGFPNIGLQGFAPKFARGEIAALSGAADDARYFQISVPVQPGNSGGALVDEHGNVVGVVAAKLNALAAFNTSGALPENVNYAVKSSFLLSFLESVPEVSAKLKEPNTKEQKSEDVAKSAEQAAVLVLVY